MRLSSLPSWVWLAGAALLLMGPKKGTAASSAAPSAAGGPTAAVLTRATAREVADAIVRARKSMGRNIARKESWLYPLALSCLETARWKKLWNRNVGNVTTTGKGVSWYTNPETTGAAKALRFAAFDSLDAGALAMLRALDRVGGLAAADAGDKAAFQRAATAYLGTGAAYPDLTSILASLASVAPTESVSGGPIMLADDFPQKAGPARDRAILDGVKNGAELDVTWIPLAMTANGHTAVFQVTADGVKLSGVRVSGSARLCQQIADLLGACLQTPKLNDACYLQAAVRIPVLPLPPPPPTTTQGMVAESAAIDRAVGGRPGLVAPVGKPWVLSSKMTASRATLYGWQTDTPPPGVTLYPSPATPGVHVVQPLSTAHDPSYADYSSLACLVRRACVVDGNKADVRVVLGDPALSALLSHEGPVPARQPGVPVLDPVA